MGGERRPHRAVLVVAADHLPVGDPLAVAVDRLVAVKHMPDVFCAPGGRDRRVTAISRAAEEPVVEAKGKQGRWRWGREGEGQGKGAVRDEGQRGSYDARPRGVGTSDGLRSSSGGDGEAAGALRGGSPGRAASLERIASSLGSPVFAVAEWPEAPPPL